MKKNLILLLLLFMYIPLIAQINKNGIPLIKNYTPNDYNAAEQNWAVCMDKRGVTYFGNNHDGVLEFDGANWNQIPTSNNSIVRSLAVDSLGTIYVGAVDEFGYLAPDINGKMQYISLCNEIPDSAGKGDVWKIYTNKNDVFFCAGINIFKFNNKKLEEIYQDTSGGFISFYVNKQIYKGNYWQGLKELKNDTIVLVKGGGFFKEKDIFVLLPLNKNELFVGTMFEGYYVYNTETGESKEISTINNTFKKLSNFLDEAQLYNGIQLKNGNFVLTTISNGCIIINKNGEILNHFTKENGLGDVTVTSAYESEEGILWLSLFNSLSYIELNSPFSKFDSKQGIEGMIMDVERFNGTLYIATSLGLYYQYFDEQNLPHFKMVKGLDGMVWKLEKIKLTDNKTRLLAGTKLNVFEIIDPKKVVNINSDNEGWINCMVLHQSKLDSNKVFVGYLAGLTSIEYNNGRWEPKDKYLEINNQIETIAQDDEGVLWLGTSLNGIIRFNISEKSIKRYGIDEGLPSLGGNKANFVNRDIVFTTNNGLYFYNRNKDTIEKYSGFGDIYSNREDKVAEVYEENDSVFWTFSQLAKEKSIGGKFEYVEKVILKNNGIQIINLPFKRFNKYSFINVSFDNNDIWFSTASAAINYEVSHDKKYDDFYNSLIRKVRINVDSVIFWGTYYKDTSNLLVDLNQPSELKKTVQYKNNSFNFFFSTPFFPTDEVKYSYMLEGFEDKWSAWDAESKRGYTNLNEGKYTFKVKAKNIYSIESEVVTYEFAIKPPWYRTILAYFFYVVLSILVVIIIVKIYTHRLELEKIRLEQIVKERTEEVVRQKDEIAEKNESITASIEYAKRIQTAILPSSQYANEILPEHFILFRPRDIVSGDFYWMNKKDDLLIVIAADCTGHGVPGAFMSMLGVSFLNEIVNRHDITSAAVILNNLRADIKKTLGQKGKEGEAKDGMDIALCIVDLKKMKMQYAGAYNPLYLYRNNELMEIKADRMPIGIYVKEKESFTNNEIDLQKGDVFYISSDGYQDQFGGDRGMKFKTKNYKQLLLEIHQKPMAEQREILNTRIDEWRGKWEQVDDIIILGIRV